MGFLKWLQLKTVSKEQSQEFTDECLKFRKKYRKEAMESYKSNNLNSWIDERARMDLNPNDNIQKYKSDLKRWFLRIKDYYNKNYLRDVDVYEWRKKLKITDNDFPWVYYIEDDKNMCHNVGLYNLYIKEFNKLSHEIHDYWADDEDYCPICYLICKCPDQLFIKKINGQK
ncbi:hypothetical protein [uncultured Brachyspira sp.]|uniref:hypothetical protein n=1 Tax=uncultured Brachyspira sp. TaxID=221953 RepID=UPI0027DC7D8C|nr:hypothetical protein [uncultured Brachyspira sp.]